MAMPSVAVQNVGRVGRISRRPKHPFHLRDVRPWQIQPCMIAPVLPGETMDNLMLQARVVTDPLANRLIGWHCEFYFFYVKHRDLTNRTDFEEMMLNPEADLSSLDMATKVETFHLNGAPSPAIDWVELCLRRVVECYFRRDGEAVTDFMIGNLPIANLGRLDWTDSFGLTANVSEGNQDFDLTSNTDGDGTSAVYTSEISQMMEQYEFLRFNNLINMTYEDFLGTYGVRPKPEEEHKPELLRYVRDWTYPNNTIDPSDGSATTAGTWSIQERADKPRFFREPGFVCGYQVLRPKVYLGNQRSSLTSLMVSAIDWLPAVTSHDPWTSMRSVDASAPPMTGIASEYIFDLKDLLLYGEDFRNFDSGGANNDENIIIADTTEGSEFIYGTEAAAQSIFSSGASAWGTDTDGVVSLNIKGTQMDSSPTAGMGSRAGN